MTRIVLLLAALAELGAPPAKARPFALGFTPFPFDDLFVTYFLHRDYDALWERIRPVVPEFFIAWNDCGLLDEAGTERPAARRWDGWLAVPLTSP